MTLIKEDTADHGILGSGSSGDTSVRVSPLAGLLGRGAGRRVRQRFRAQSLERADRRASARLGQRFRAQRARRQRRVRVDPAVQAERFRRDGVRSQALGNQPVAAQRFGNQPADRRAGPRSGRLDRAGSPVRRGDPDDQVGQAAAHTGQTVQAQAVAGGHASPGGQEGREGHLRRHRLRGRRSHSATPIPTTRPSSSKPPATSTWKTATPARRSSRSTRKPSIRTPRPPWPRRPFADDDEEEEDDGFDSAVSSEMTGSGRRRRRSAGPERAAAADGARPRVRGRMERPLGRRAGRHHRLPVLRRIRRVRPRQEPLRVPVGGTMGSGLVSSLAKMFGG